MFIVNYATTDLVVRIKDNRITIGADSITYVDENIVSLVQLKNMYGNLVEEVADATLTASLDETYLKYTQVEINLDTLYKIQLGRYSVANELKSIFVSSGSVDIYSYEGSIQPTSTSEMSLIESSTGVEGEAPLEIVPTYIAIKQNVAGANTTSIILSGIEIISTLGAIT